MTDEECLLVRVEINKVASILHHYNSIWSKDLTCVSSQTIRLYFMVFQVYVLQLSTHYKELNAKTVAKNPHFVALVLARETNTEQPTVTSTGDAQKLKVRLESANGSKDMLTITPENITFSRESKK